MIRFTIITCTYNAGRVLQRTLNSIKEQSHRCIQHIIIDGASTDNTMDIVEEYRQESSEGIDILAVSEKDRGLYDAMNKGLRMAQGDYVIFLNAGDKFHSHDTLRIVAERAGDDMEHLPGIVYGDTNIVDGANHYVGKRRHQPPMTLNWKSFKRGMLVCHQAFYVRTDMARKTNYNTKYRFSADVDWCIRIMKACETFGLPIVNSHEVLCDFLAGGMSIENHRASLTERFWIMVNHYGMFTTIVRHLGFVKKSL